jgi:hypothetical protein
VGAADDLRAGGVGEARQLIEVLLDVRYVVTALAGRAGQKGALDGRLDLDELSDTTNIDRGTWSKERGAGPWRVGMTASATRWVLLRAPCPLPLAPCS